MMYYEEWHDGAWQRLDVDGEMLTGRAHHMIFFASPADWQRYPAWARERRTEIIARIKSEFREPDYEYHGDEAAPPPEDEPPQDPPPSAPQPPSPLPQVSPPNLSHEATQSRRHADQGWGVVGLVIVFLLLVAGGLGWLVKTSLDSGTTTMLAKHSSITREVSRDLEPVMFWMLVTLYTTLGFASLGGSLWMTRQWRLSFWDRRT